MTEFLRIVFDKCGTHDELQIVLFKLFLFDICKLHCFSLRKQSQRRHTENILAFVETLLNCPVCAAAESSSFKITVSLNEA